MGIFWPLLNHTDQSQKHPKDIKQLLEINPTPITPASMYLFLSLSVSLHNSSRVSHFWEKPLHANFTCLVITFCYWRRDIKHSGVFSWEQPRCDPWNKLNIRRKEAACQRWEWQEQSREGCLLLRSASLRVSDGWRKRCCHGCWNITKAQRRRMEVPASPWKMRADLKTSRTLHVGVFCMQVKW